MRRPELVGGRAEARDKSETRRLSLWIALERGHVYVHDMESRSRMQLSREERGIERYTDEYRPMRGQRLGDIMKILHRARSKRLREIRATGRMPHNRVTSSPGEIMRELFLRPRKLGIEPASRKLHMSLTELKAILSSEIRLTRVHAKKLAALTGTSQSYWLNLERSYRRSAATQALLQALQKSQRQMRRGQRGRPMEEVTAGLRRRISAFRRMRAEGATER